jgi:hypothetical protein
MSKTFIEKGYRLVLPPEAQALVSVGTPVQVTIDKAGRIILTPESQAQAILRETFGMWADRDDIPPDGVTYMDEARRGQRLDDFGITPDEIA